MSYMLLLSLDECPCVATGTYNNTITYVQILVQDLSFLLNSTIQVSYMDPAQPVFLERIFGSDPCTVEDLKMPAT
jgi:hypothetical protein